MRLVCLSVALVVASTAIAPAEARGRIRFRLPWSSSSAGTAPAAPAAPARSGALVVLPAGGLAAGTQAKEAPGDAPKARPAVAPEAARPHPAAASTQEAKVDRCARGTLVGAGAGFCSFN